MTSLSQTIRPLRMRPGGDRNRVADLVRERCWAAGRTPGGFIGRLWNGSFVSPAHRFVYVETPKVASTKIKYFVAELEQAKPAIDRRPYLAETRPVMLIHQRRDLAIPTVLDLPFADAQALFDGRSDFFVFALSRNPYARLVSAYENKVRLGEPGFGAFCDRWAAADAGANVRESFIDFVRDGLPALIKNGEHHFVDQFGGIGPDVLPYTRVFRCEQFEAFEQVFLDHLRAHGVAQPPAFRDDVNRSHGRSWRHYYDEATAARAAHIFRRDFAAFDYDPEDWRPQDEPSPLVTTDSEARWRRAVIDRNRMIEMLHKLSPPPTPSRLIGHAGR